MVKYLLTIVLVALLSYGVLEAWPLLSGPSLSLESPTENGSYPGGIVAVRGKAERAAELTLSGAPLFRDQDGSFSSTLTFPRGGSILTFEAQDRFGRTVTLVRSIFVP
jgi:hypothetical protein